MYYMLYASPVGDLLLTSDGAALTGLWMNRPAPQNGVCGHPVLEKAGQWLDRYFQDCPCEVDFPLSPKGTAFQRLVWQELLTIPYGTVCTYGDLSKIIAGKLGKEKMSAQAIGGAVGANPISILIPCHRVVGSGGKLTGYAGGLERKAWLLRHEHWLK